MNDEWDYGEETTDCRYFQAGSIVLALRELADYLDEDDNRALIGCWNVDGEGAGQIQAVISVMPEPVRRNQTGDAGTSSVSQEGAGK